MKNFLRSFIFVVILFPLFLKADPIILVPGWGHNVVADMSKFKKLLIQQGIPNKDIYLTRYSYLEDFATIQSELKTQFSKIFSLYPKGTKFKVVTHSMGHIAALYTIMQENLTDYVSAYVGIAGWAHGGKRLAFCQLQNCGKAAEDTFTPSPFLDAFYTKYEKEVAHLKKCSIYTTDDEVIVPYDSGKFADGKNIEVSGYGHVEMVKRKPIAKLVLNECLTNLD